MLYLILPFALARLLEKSKSIRDGSIYTFIILLLIEGTRPLLERVELDGEAMRALCKRTKIVSLSEDSVLAISAFDSIDSRVIAFADVLRLLLILDSVVVI